jgi:hypothetical protein
MTSPTQPGLSLKPSANAFDEVVQVTHPSEQQKQRCDPPPSKKNDGLRIVMYNPFPNHRGSPQVGYMSVYYILIVPSDVTVYSETLKNNPSSLLQIGIFNRLVNFATNTESLISLL